MKKSELYAAFDRRFWLRLCAINDELQLLTCLSYGLWGAKKNIFRRWQSGDYLVFTERCYSETHLREYTSLVGIAEISGAWFFDESRIWENGLYPYRIPIIFAHFLDPNDRPPFPKEIGEAFKDASLNLGLRIVGQTPIPDDLATPIFDEIAKYPNALESVQNNLPRRIAEAYRRRHMLDAFLPSNLRPSGPPAWLAKVVDNGNK